MGKIAFLFSGQGAQTVGMGKSFYESFDEIKTLFDKCESLRPGTLDAMFNGPDELLKDTKVTQPCLYLCDLAAAIAVKNAGIKADAVCGFSLGEIPALAFAGSYSYEEGFGLVIKRAIAMAKAAEKNPASMVAVVKLTNDKVLEACDMEDVYPVNFNCEGQVSVSLKAEKTEELEQRVKALGGRVLPLKVSGGFHSPFMNEAAEEFAVSLDEVAVKTPEITAYSNVTARPYEDDVVSVLKKQINNPVKWEDTIKHLSENGYDTFIETGVGSKLK
ncbi:MAG: ACP S-malonyltransferase, partial [Clostridia bacterium]|nr:ACP S-malonyltransferase [Clostridia bacterium]